MNLTCRPSEAIDFQVTLVVVSYNSASYLRHCLEALEQQTLKPDRLIVVDNHSDENDTHSLLQDLDGIAGVQVIRLSENLGYGGAINRALTQSPQCTFLACLNPDAYPEPEWLASLLACAHRHPKAASVASLLLNAQNPESIDGAGDLLLLSGFPRRRYHGKALSSVALTEDSVFSACAGACLYRAEALRELGGFDERYFMYVEDVDLGARLQLLGYDCVFTPWARVLHEGSATTGYRSAFSTYHGHRNVGRLLLKNMPLRLLPFSLVAHVLVSVGLLPIMLFRWRLGSYLRAKLGELLDVPRALRDRSSVRRIVLFKQFLNTLSLPIQRKASSQVPYNVETISDDAQLVLRSYAEWQQLRREGQHYFGPRLSRWFAWRAQQEGIEDPVLGDVPSDELIIDSENFRESVLANDLISRCRGVFELLKQWFPDDGEAWAVYASEALSPLASRLKSHYPGFVGSEYLPEAQDRERHPDVMHQNVLDFDFADNQFDAYISCDVLEHLPDLSAAVHEAYRILNPGGRFFGTVPLKLDDPKGEVRARLEAGEVIHLMEPEYHGNPARPEEGSLVFTLPSWDLLELFKEAGFSDAGIVLMYSRRHGIFSQYSLFEPYFFAVK